MFLKNIDLKNVGCFKHLELSFELDDSQIEVTTKNKIRQRSVLLGDNGTGKSTILKSIALITAGSSALGEIIGNPDSWIKNGTEFCEISSKIVNAKGEERKLLLRIERGDHLSKIMKRNSETLEAIDNAIYHTDRHYLTIAYGVSRKIGSRGLNSQSRSNFSSPRAENVSSLFDKEAVLYPIESWVIDQDYSGDKSSITTIKRVFRKLLPDVSFKNIDKKNKELIFKTPDGDIPFQALSDGYQTTANWIGDLLYRISNTFAERKKPLTTRFLLLIDEIALHLHPEWQRTILDFIQEFLPNVQLIVSTHSPFIAQQAGPRELFSLERKRSKIDVYQHKDDPRKMLIHQLIMSPLFGLSTDESLHMEKLQKENFKNSSEQVDISLRNREMFNNDVYDMFRDLKSKLEQNPEE